LNGVIAAITPIIGSRIVCTRRCLPWCVRSQAKLCPSSTSACCAENSSTSLARPTSYKVSLMHRPDSSVISRASSSRREAMMSPAFIRIL
jgi:hypothetical protein